MRNTFPNTFILGAAKAGTTTLTALLRQHPTVFFSFDKEPMFFSKEEHFSRGIEWYARTYFKDSASFPIRAEATPHYLYWAEKVAPRIQQSLPSGPKKFIVTLRNPITRAYSWYWNMVAEGREDLPFLDALEAEDARLKEHFTSLQSNGSMVYGYYKGGAYSSQLQTYFQFFPRDQFYILLLDDLKNTPEKIRHELLEFLEIDSSQQLDPDIQNASRAPRSKFVHGLVRNPSKIKNVIKAIIPADLRYKIKTFTLKKNLKPFTYPPMKEEAYQYLREKYLPEIEALSELLQRDLSFWLTENIPTE